MNVQQKSVLNSQIKSIMRKKQAGITAVEMLIYVAAVAVILLVVLPILQGVLSKTSTSAEMQAITDTMARVETYRKANNIDGTLDNAFMIRNNLVSPSYKVNGALIYNTFNKPVVFEGVATNGFRYSTTVPSSSCPENAENGMVQGFDSVEIGGTSLQYSDTTPDDRAQACEGAVGTADVIEIVYVTDAS